VTVTDEFDGSANAGTVRFGLDGDTYEVDLSATNEDELRGFLSHYIQVGRRLSISGRPYTTTNAGIDPPDHLLDPAPRPAAGSATRPRRRRGN